MNKLIQMVKENHPYLFAKGFKQPTNLEWLKSPTGNKAIWCNENVNEKLDPNTTTVIGGICGTKASSLEKLSGIDTIRQFEEWHYSWYPRIDQIHDSIGIPPKSCKNVTYVFEDNTHTDRILNLKKDWGFLDVREILQGAHDSQGKNVLENWLRLHGYKGTISFVFLSELEKEIEIAIRLGLRLGLKREEKNKQIRKLMYTSLWPSVLGIEKDTLIYEPIHYINRHYCRYNTLLDDIAILSYIPYLSYNWELDKLPHDLIPNFSNHLQLPNDLKENGYIATNLLFSKEKVVSDPNNYDFEFGKKIIYEDLEQYFSI